AAVLYAAIPPVTPTTISAIEEPSSKNQIPRTKNRRLFAASFGFWFFGSWLLLQVAEVQFHRLAGALELAYRANLLRSIEVDFVLYDLLQHDRHLVLRALIDERAAAGVELHQPLLNQRAQLEPSTHLVHDRLFLQSIKHVDSSVTYSQRALAKC